MPFTDFHHRYDKLSKHGLKHALHNICDRMADWLDDQKSNGRIGGENVNVELISTKNYLESSKYVYPDGERRHEHKLFAVTWQDDPEITILPNAIPLSQPSSEEIKQLVVNHIRDKSIIVASEEFFDQVGGLRELKRKLNEPPLAERTYNVKTIESLRLNDRNRQLWELKKTLADQVFHKKGLCTTYAFRYVFFRFFLNKNPMSHYFKIIAESYGL